VLQSRCHTRFISQVGHPGAWSEASTPLSGPLGPMAKVAMDKFNVNDLVDLLASMEDTVGRVTGVRDGGTRIRVLWQHRRGYEGYTTIHDSSALRKIPAVK
jgi:hypothetical protein